MATALSDVERHEIDDAPVHRERRFRITGPHPDGGKEHFFQVATDDVADLMADTHVPYARQPGDPLEPVEATEDPRAR